MRRVLMIVLLAAFAIESRATLVVDGTLMGGALVTDTDTGLQWLSPVATRAQSYNSVAGGYGGLTTAQGFQFASQSQVLSMISAYFPSLQAYSYTPSPPTNPGTAAGAVGAQAFFNIFGIGDNFNCSTPPGPCPRTQGLTSNPGNAPASHYLVGVIEVGAGTAAQLGWTIFNNSYLDTFSGDRQVGSWLVRPIPPVPLLPAVWLLASGLLGLLGVGARARRRATA